MLSGNDIHDEGGGTLVAALSQNRSLKGLYLASVRGGGRRGEGGGEEGGDGEERESKEKDGRNEEEAEEGGSRGGGSGWVRDQLYAFILCY